MMTDEQKKLSKQREKDFFGGEEISSEGKESRVRGWGKDMVLKETKSSEENFFPDLTETEEYLLKKKKDYDELKGIFGGYLLNTHFFRAPSKNDPEKIVNYAAQRKIKGQVLDDLKERNEVINDPSFRDQIKDIIWLNKKNFVEKGALIDIHSKNIMREETGDLFIVDPGPVTFVKGELKAPRENDRRKAENYFRNKFATMRQWEELLEINKEERRSLDEKFGMDESLYYNKMEEYISAFLSEKSETRIEAPEDVKPISGIWEKVLGGRPIDIQRVFESGKLDREKLKDELYESIKPAIEKTIEVLGIRPDGKILESLEEKGSKEELSLKQLDIVRSLTKQFKKVPDAKWSFFPKEIQRTGKINCSGSALLMGYMFNKLDIENYYSSLPGHAANIVRLADDSMFYINPSMRTDNLDNLEPNVVKIKNAEEKEINDIPILKIDQPDIEYSIITLLDQKESVSNILGNLGSLKESVIKKDDREAGIVHDRIREFIEKIDFGQLESHLYPELNSFHQSREYKEESKEIETLRDYGKRLADLKEGILFSEITEEDESRREETERQVIEELRNNSSLVSEFLIKSKKDITFDDITKIKKTFSGKAYKLLLGVADMIQNIRDHNPDEAQKICDKILAKMQ